MWAFVFLKLLHPDWKPVGRKQNYSFDRRQREKTRAIKKAERQRTKQEKSDQRKKKPGTDSAPNQWGEPLEHQVTLSAMAPIDLRPAVSDSIPNNQRLVQQQTDEH